MPFRFILPLHVLIRNYISRKFSYGTTSPDYRTYSQTTRSLLDFIKLSIFFFFFFNLFMLQDAFYILAQSSKCALQFLSIRWMWSCSNHHLPLPPGSTGLSIFLTVFLFEMLYNLLGWGTIPEKKHIQRTAIRYCTICFQVGCFQATLKETALS